MGRTFIPTAMTIAAGLVLASCGDGQPAQTQSPNDSASERIANDAAENAANAAAMVKKAEDDKARDETAVLMSATETRNNMLVTLPDPNSAIFRNVRAVRFLEGWVFCGEINSRDRLGEYTGFQEFVALGHQASYQRDAHDWAKLSEPCRGQQIITTPF